MKNEKFDPVKVNLLGKLREIDHRLDWIRLPEEETTVEGQSLTQWLEEHAGQKAKDFFLLVSL